MVWYETLVVFVIGDMQSSPHWKSPLLFEICKQHSKISSQHTRRTMVKQCKQHSKIADNTQDAQWSDDVNYKKIRSVALTMLSLAQIE